MIDREIKRCLGQMMKGVEVVGARHAGVARAYTSHWVTQVSFDAPVVAASVSPKHDTYAVMRAAGEFSVSILAGDQIAEGQYFSYPGRTFHRALGEYLTDWPDDPDGPPVVPNSIAWMRCRITDEIPMNDHRLVIATVDAVVPGRLREPPLLYSSRLGWRIAGASARSPGVSVRDDLIERVRAAGHEVDDTGDDED